MSVCKTIKEPTIGVFKDRRSEFYAFAYHIKTEDEVKEVRQILKKKYHDAKHHVYVMKLGCGDNAIVKLSDDGEPHNSSAPSVLGQIKAYNLSDILIVVVRYFGGKKLGIPGLINAYKTAAKLAIENAEIIERKDESIIVLEAGYDKLGSAIKFAKKNSLKIIQMDSKNNGYVIKLLVENSLKNDIKEKLGKMGCTVKIHFREYDIES